MPSNKREHTYRAGEGGGRPRRRTPEQRLAASEKQAGKRRAAPVREELPDEDYGYEPAGLDEDLETAPTRDLGTAEAERAEGAGQNRRARADGGRGRGGRGKPGGKGPNPFVQFFKTLTPLKRNILIGCTALLLVGCILLVIFLPSCSGGASTSLSSTSLSAETDYDPNANALLYEQFQGTILSETEDAGQEYVDDTVFLGDSNTVRLLGYSDVTGLTVQNAIGVEGMGIQSVTSYKCVQFEGYSSLVTMPQAVEILQPRRVVIAFGTNNVGGMSVDGFISSYKDALDAIHSAYPSADIIIAAVIPVDQYHSNQSITMTNIDKYNVALAELADDEGYKFLNWSEVLRDENTGFAKSTYTVSDGIHITRDCADAMLSYYRTHAYITEDTRPKPLKDIPRRLNADVGLIGNESTTPNTTSSTSVSSSSSSSQLTANVSFSAGTGGQISVGGGTYSTFSNYVALGTSISATAVPNAGYVFTGWSLSGPGTLSSTSSASTTLTLTASVSAGANISVTASFAPASTTTSAPPPEPSVPPEPSSTPSESSEAPPSSQAPSETEGGGDGGEQGMPPASLRSTTA